MIFEILFCLAVVLLLSYNGYKYWTYWRYTAKFPGPIAFPLIGNMLQLGYTPTEHIINVAKFCKFYDNKIYRLYFGGTPYFFLTNPKDVEVILSSSTIIKKTDVYEFLEPWLGQGLLTSDGSKWRKHRKMITPAFHFSILQDFLEIIKKCSRTFITKLNEKEKNGDIFDIQSMTHSLAFDIMCGERRTLYTPFKQQEDQIDCSNSSKDIIIEVLALMGKRSYRRAVASLLSQKCLFFSTPLNELIQETAMGVEMKSLDDSNVDITRAYHDICYTIQNRFFSVLKRSNLFYLFYPECHRHRKAVKVVRSFLKDLIQKRRHILTNSIGLNNNFDNGNDNNSKRKRAFLDKLLTETIDNVPLTNDEIADEVSTIAFAAHDTTSSAIALAAFLLSRHLNIQEKVFKEQYEIFGNDADRDPTYQEIQSMKYLDMFIKEAQRVLPSVPSIGRKAETEININGQKIPKGSGIFIGIMYMNLNEKIFEDPLKFDPERFSSERVATNPYEYTPFSAGPRNCIGKRFAILELKTVLSIMVRNFEILPPDDSYISSGNYVRELKYLYDSNIKKQHYDPIWASMITLQSVNGIFIRLKRRQHL